jgi:hypothetical protein
LVRCCAVLELCSAILLAHEAATSGSFVCIFAP